MVTVYSFRRRAYVNFHNTRSAAVLRPNKFNTMYAIGQAHTVYSKYSSPQHFSLFFLVYFSLSVCVYELDSSWSSQRKSSRIHSMLTGYHTMKNRRRRIKKTRAKLPFISGVINVVATLSSSRSTFENKIIKYYLCVSYFVYRKCFVVPLTISWLA